MNSLSCFKCQASITKVVLFHDLISVNSLSCFNCQASHPTSIDDWRYLSTINEQYAIEDYFAKINMCMQGNHTNVTLTPCERREGFDVHCALQNGVLSMTGNGELKRSKLKVDLKD